MNYTNNPQNDAFLTEFLNEIKTSGNPDEINDDSYEEDKQDFDDWGSQQEENYLNSFDNDL